jgi:hypothetical protein
MKRLLFYIEDENGTRKTKRFYVYSSHSNDKLGVIQWRTGWRCYVMSYDDDIEMSVSCMKELNEFIESLEQERKAQIEKELGEEND